MIGDAGVTAIHKSNLLTVEIKDQIKETVYFMSSAHLFNTCSPSALFYLSMMKYLKS